MILFFIAASLFQDVKDIEKKVFNTEVQETEKTEEVIENKTRSFKLMPKVY